MAENEDDFQMETESKADYADPDIQILGRKRSSEESSPVEDVKRQILILEEQETIDTTSTKVDQIKEDKCLDEVAEVLPKVEEKKTVKKTKIGLQALLFSDEELDNLSSTESSNSDTESDDNSNDQADSSEDMSSDDDLENELPKMSDGVLNSNSSQVKNSKGSQQQNTETSNQERKPYRHGFSAGPLSLIAEAMRSFNLSFPKFEQSYIATERTGSSDKVEETEETDEGDDSEDSDEIEENRKPEDSSKETCAEKATEDRKRTANWNNENDDSSSSTSVDESSSLSPAEKPTNLEKNDPSAPKDEKSNAFPINTFSVASDKDSDSDDSSCRRKTKTSMLDNNSGRDFFEDDSSFEEEKIGSREYDWINAELSHPNVLNDYEQVFHEIRKIMEKVPNRFKFDIYCLLYPTLVMVFLRMVGSGKFRRGKAFVDSSLRYIDDSYLARVENLMTLQSAADLPKKAKKLLANEGDDQIIVSLCEESCDLLLILINHWSPSLQMAFLRHFDIVSKNNDGQPFQIHRIGSATLEKIYWATESAKEKKETSPRPSMRRKRFKKSKASPTKNIHMPTGNRLYTPMPKRWDLERQKDDEEHRVTLNRDQLPSVYVYTSLVSAEIVICATFSNTSTILCLGTTSATIHIFSLSPSKLVQLKPANSLRKLDTSMSGIDESMLDTSNMTMKRKLYGHQGPIYGCSFAPNDRFLLTSSVDRTVRCWCLLTWKCVVIYPGHSSAVFCVNYAPFGYYFASGSDDRTARIWTQDNKKSICILVGHLAEVVCCKFHPNRHYLATGSADCTIRLWDIIKAVQVRVFSGHRGTISALAFSVCGRYLVTGADDDYIIVWDIDKELLVQSLLKHKGSINCIEFPYDNNIFVVGGQDCQLSIWDFARLVQEYEESLKDIKSKDFKPSKLNTEDLLIKSYFTKGTPFYKLHFTTRNLLIAYCVELAKTATEESKKTAESIASYEEWLTFLDILKLKSCFAGKRYETEHGEDNPTNGNNESLDDDINIVSDEYKQEDDIIENLEKVHEANENSNALLNEQQSINDDNESLNIEENHKNDSIIIQYSLDALTDNINEKNEIESNDTVAQVNNEPQEAINNDTTDDIYTDMDYDDYNNNEVLSNIDELEPTNINAENDLQENEPKCNEIGDDYDNDQLQAVVNYEMDKDHISDDCNNNDDSNNTNYNEVLQENNEQRDVNDEKIQLSVETVPETFNDNNVVIVEVQDCTQDSSNNANDEDYDITYNDNDDSVVQETNERYEMEDGQDSETFEDIIEFSGGTSNDIVIVDDKDCDQFVSDNGNDGTDDDGNDEVAQELIEIREVTDAQNLESFNETTNELFDETFNDNSVVDNEDCEEDVSVTSNDGNDHSTVDDGDDEVNLDLGSFKDKSNEFVDETCNVNAVVEQMDCEQNVSEDANDQNDDTDDEICQETNEVHEMVAAKDSANFIDTTNEFGDETFNDNAVAEVMDCVEVVSDKANEDDDSTDDYNDDEVARENCATNETFNEIAVVDDQTDQIKCEQEVNINEDDNREIANEDSNEKVNDEENDGTESEEKLLEGDKNVEHKEENNDTGDEEKVNQKIKDIDDNNSKADYEQMEANNEPGESKSSSKDEYSEDNDNDKKVVPTVDELLEKTETEQLQNDIEQVESDNKTES